MSFKTEWRWKPIKVFLEQSAVGPFADVMRRHVALMGHYTKWRVFFSKRYWMRQLRCIYRKHTVFCAFWFLSILYSLDLGQIWSESWQAGSSWVNEGMRGRLHSFYNAAGFKYIIALSCIDAQVELVLVPLPRKITNQYDLITTWATAG